MSTELTAIGRAVPRAADTEEMPIEYERAPDGGEERKFFVITEREERDSAVTLRSYRVVALASGIFTLIAYSFPYWEWVSRLQEGHDFLDQFQAALSRINLTQSLNEAFVPEECPDATRHPLFEVLDQTLCVKTAEIIEKTYNQTVCRYVNRINQEWFPTVFPLMGANMLMGVRFMVMNCQSRTKWDTKCNRAATFLIGAASASIGMMGILQGYNVSGSWTFFSGITLITGAVASHRRVTQLFSYLGRQFGC